MTMKEIVNDKFYDVIDLSNQDEAYYFIVSYTNFHAIKPFIPRLVRLNSPCLNKKTINEVLKAVGGDVLLSASMIGYMTKAEFNV